MSGLITKLLEWAKVPQWVLALGFALLLIGGIWYWHHATYKAGIAAQVAEDKASALDATIIANRETDRQRTRADKAESTNAQERKELADYQRNHPVSIRVCVAPGAAGHLPTTAGSPQTATGSPAAGLQPVPAGDSGAGADLGPMLDALAASADAVSGDLREYQSRE